MTMWPRSSRAIPTMTAQVARAAFPKGCLAIRVRDALGELFEDVEFAGLFAVGGRPAVSPARLALVSVLQFAEGLSDRQAADAVRGRIDWKYALGLELTDTGFDASEPVAQRWRELDVSGVSGLGSVAVATPAGWTARAGLAGSRPWSRLRRSPTWPPAGRPCAARA
jgi:transposase